ncbi:DUF5701 family protein [Mycobacterium sp. 21AC1]|uniref:DUF5701 family protein n=1 Tax=[Mycobacterium] appelbergii TaxID=2939269 RepID=UPI0029394FF2|nr:DUF5701 family protein [Mycobacterium sp. 21AC1]MDV3126323.1 DUF5701 family protein [Mycobacterium sp. 21AC1]
MPTATPSTLPALPPVAEQAERWIALGLRAETLQAVTDRADDTGALLVVHPDLMPASVLAPMLSIRGKAGFVVADMTDVDDFAPIPSVSVPEAAAYLVSGLDRGDDMANWSPDEALPAILAAGRTPLTLSEGLQWVLQQPDALQRGHCFMTIASRLSKPDGSLDARTPALWISNGTGRDGAANRNAPKVGWCWAGNRHTWLGFASAGLRALPG